MRTQNEDLKLVVVEVDLAVCSMQALNNTLYWYSDKYDIDLVKNMDMITVSFRAGDQPLPDGLAAKFKRDLIDSQVREQVRNETTVIRELILAKAFSN